MRNCLCLICFMLSFATVHGQTCKPDSIPASTPDSQLTDNGNGTISDIKTGLMWKKCVEGITGSDCDTGTETTFTWQQALEQPGMVNSATGFAGYHDWRLPNIKELTSIVEEQCSFPAINLNRFPNTSNFAVWSGSPNAIDSFEAWSVVFNVGYSNAFWERVVNFEVRLVRSGQDCNGDEGGTAYIDNCNLCVGGNTGILPCDITTVTSAGQIWMDRNLGASRVATSYNDSEAYGDLYQWGRYTDGHEKRTSPTTTELSSTDVPGHGNFISSYSDPYDWRDPQNNNLWQGESGTNNPCPSGFRLPTSTEFEVERLSWSSNSRYGAFDSPLKLVAAGWRRSGDGVLTDAGNFGFYWFSTVNGIFSRSLGFYSGGASTSYNVRVIGCSVRCLKD